MENIADYVKRVGQDTWEERPAGELDFAAFSQIVYLPLHMALQDDEPLSLDSVALAMAELKVESLFSIYYRKRLELMRDMAALPRYAGILLSDYVHEVNPEDQKQFCAVTISLPGPLKVICFEGTDLSLAGWKEDFNMSFESPVPSQKEACHYLERLAGLEDLSDFILLGHSKGGNLAVYCAAYAPLEIQKRIEAVYSFDSPGLMDKDVASAGYQAVSDRIHAYLPQSSLVGVLMCRHEPSIIIKSSAIGVFQHDLFSWRISPGDSVFIRMQELSNTAQLRDEVLSDWLADMSFEDREKFFDAVYQVVSADENRERLSDLFRISYKDGSSSLKALQEIDPTTRQMMRRMLKALFSSTLETVKEAAKDAVTDIQDKVRDRFSL
ncbi:MAG: DUF2974 domain-containing protein [Clostridiales bacterium]|nr:DUF2974 domain-containing protein [Clostridiales bacterium]